jgi:hypothetical protein
MRLWTEFTHGPHPKQLVARIAEATGGKDGSYAVQDANCGGGAGKVASFEVLGGHRSLYSGRVAGFEQERFEKYQEESWWNGHRQPMPIPLEKNRT